MEYNFATKDDIKGIHTEIAVLRYSLQSMEYKMTIKFGLMQTAGIALLAALIKLF